MSDLDTLIKKTGLFWDFDATFYHFQALCCSPLDKTRSETEATAQGMKMESRSIHVLSTIMTTNVMLEPSWVKRRNLDSQPTAVPHQRQQNKAKTPVQPPSFQSAFVPVSPHT